MAAVYAALGMRAIENTAIFEYLQSEDPALFGRALEVRAAAQRWLAFVPATFPHYTQHTVEHSDAIVVQLSQLLFRDGDVSSPAVRLSSVEAYILIVSAYLHDAGMVTSDGEKVRLMRSDEWEAFTGPEGHGRERWDAITALREAAAPNPHEANFIADVQLRFLLAEFVRRNHHVRSATFLMEHHAALAGVAYEDPALLRSIAAVCVGHGLTSAQLQDPGDYPERRVVLGEPVNVRFLSILLRLGDLLDMSADRACPLLLSAVSPLPPESYAHWSQYQRVTHQLTAPDRIEVTAECETQEEHRFLADWCSWLVDELRTAEWLMSRAARHGSWKAPRAEMAGPDISIKIRPAADAQYLPVEWRMQIDEEEVVGRLVRDAYGDRLAFVKELIQNAADASRCRLYRDLEATGTALPESPPEADRAVLERYPITVRLSETEVPNDLATTTERRQIVTVEDVGIGMDDSVVTRFLLQVGRSYYRTAEFRRQYPFQPGSQFGIGFLSVFAESDHVVVETRRADVPNGLKLKLTGVRNYLLTERGDRDGPGTRVDVLLRKGVAESDLVRAVRRWCRMLEFPVLLETPGGTLELRAEEATRYETTVPDVTTPGASFAIRAFPVRSKLLSGHLFIRGYVDEQGGESWGLQSWADYRYPDLAPHAIAPKPPSSLVCVQGITATEDDYTHSGWSYRVDVRGPIEGLSLSRTMTQGLRQGVMRELVPLWTEILSRHIRTASHALPPHGWRYLQQLMSVFENRFNAFWLALPNTVRVWHGAWRLESLASLAAEETIATAWSGSTGLGVGRGMPQVQPDPEWVEVVPSISESDLARLSDLSRETLFNGRHVTKLEKLADGPVVATWQKTSDVPWQRARRRGPMMELLELPDARIIGFSFQRVDSSAYERYVLNVGHPFTQWCLRVADACEHEQYGLRFEQAERLYGLVESPVGYQGLKLDELSGFVEAWRSLDLPAELLPPIDPLGREAFVRRGPITPARANPGT